MQLGVEFVVREYDGIGAIAAAIVNREVDVVPAVAVSNDREISVDFTNHYHRSGLANAVRAEKTGHRWL